MDEQLGDDASSPTSLAPVCARWTSSLAVASPSISTDEQIPVAPILRQRVPAAGCRGQPRLSSAPPLIPGHPRSSVPARCAVPTGAAVSSGQQSSQLTSSAEPCV